MRYYVKINNVEYEVEVDQGKVGVVSTREVSHADVVSTAASAPASAEVKVQLSGQAQTEPRACIRCRGRRRRDKAPMPGVILDIKVNSAKQ